MMSQMYIMNPYVHNPVWRAPSGNHETFSVGATATDKDAGFITLDSVDARWGSGYWGIVIKTNDGRAYVADAEAISGSDLTLVSPLSYYVPDLPAGAITGLTVGFFTDDGNAGQHTSNLGGEAYGRLIYDLLEDDTESLTRPGNIYRRDCGADLSAESVKWEKIGGGAGGIIYQHALNIQQGSAGGGIVIGQSTPLTVVDTRGAGQGAELVVPVGGQACQALIDCCSHANNYTVNPLVSTRVIILADAVEITNVTIKGGVRQVSALIPSGTTNVTFRVTQDAAGNIQHIRIGEIVIKKREVVSNPLTTANKIVALGDSWFDRPSRPEILDTIESLSSKTIIDAVYSLGGMTSTYGKAWVNEAITAEGLVAGDLILVHYAINDNNSISGTDIGDELDPDGNTLDPNVASWSEYKENLEYIGQTCVNKGINVVFITAPPTNSGLMQSIGINGARILTYSQTKQLGNPVISPAISDAITPVISSVI